LKHIPVLLLTGAFEPVDQAKAVAVGCDGVLAKPFEPQLVIARVKELLERGGQGAAAPALAKSAESLLPPAKNPPASKSDVAQLDSYFDQLDAAFQTLDISAPADQLKGSASASPVTDNIDWFGGPPSAPPADLPLTSAKPAQRVEPASSSVISQRADAVIARPAREEAPSQPPSPPALPPPAAMPRLPPAAVLPVQSAAVPLVPSAAVPSVPSAARAPVPSAARPPVPSAALPPVPSGALPPLADAFAAILAAEQHEARPAGTSVWPSPAASSNGGGSLSEEVIEDITRRVLDRLSDRIVHDTVAEVISEIAERLVQEEIDRIKSTIK
jgi:CheY-like chemotaxis protein